MCPPSLPHACRSRALTEFAIVAARWHPCDHKSKHFIMSSVSLSKQIVALTWFACKSGPMKGDTDVELSYEIVPSGGVG